MLGKLKKHDVARVEMHMHMVTVKAVDELIHLHRAKQIAVEENVFHVQVHPEFFSIGQQLADGLACPAIAHVVAGWFMILTPRHVNCARDDQEIFRTEMMRRLSHLACQLHAARALLGIVACERVRPKQE